MTDTPRPIILDDDDHDHLVNLVGRRFRRTLVIALVVAVFAVVTASDADASPTNGAWGIATMTSQSDCPDGLKVALTLVEDDDRVWTLVAQPLHLGCTARTDLPSRFVGAWDETGEHLCNLSTGVRCLEGVDRPGRLLLGSQAAVRALIEVPITYVRGSFRLSGAAILWRAGS